MLESGRGDSSKNILSNSCKIGLANLLKIGSICQIKMSTKLLSKVAKFIIRKMIQATRALWFLMSP